MEKRLLLAIALTFLVTVFWMRFCVPRPEVPPKSSDPTADSEKPKDDPTPTQTDSDSEKEADQPETDEPKQDQPDVPAVAPQIWEIGTPTQELVLSNQGGGSVRSARLKTYFKKPGLSAEERLDPENWLPLLAGRDGKPASLVLRDLNQDYELDSRYWEWDEPETDADGATHYRFRTQVDGGLLIVKTISVPAAAAAGELPVYDLRCTVRITNESYAGSRRRWNFLLSGAAGLVEEVDDPFAVTRAQTISRVPGRDEFESDSESLPIDEDKRPTGENLLGAAVVGKYFIGGILAEDTEGEISVFIEPLDREKASSHKVHWKPEDGTGMAETLAVANVTTSLRFGFQLPEPGITKEASFLFYLGPKDPSLLQEKAAYRPIYSVMEEDYGSILGFMTRGLIALLHLFEAIVGNFGFAIILLTLLVRMILFPLNRKQQVTMQEYQKKMVVLKPKLEEMREKYKNNRQKFSQEQMKLLKEHKATPPLAGCLPIFLQLPIFIGLFTALRVDINLRHSPFIGWIQDLSQPDRLIEGLNLNLLIFNVENFNLLPILMTITWIVNQSMMPKSEDPQQRATQKMMMIMPIIFAFMLYRYASGLSLYMFTSSLLGIFEQRVVKKTLDTRRLKQQELAAAT